MKKANISAVIIGLNEEKYLEECIKSVKDLIGVYIEKIIYVDSGSSDRSVEIAKKQSVQVIRIRNPYRSPGYARNIGLEQVETEFVLFLDGDMVIEKYFLSHALPEFETKSVVCVCGQIKERYPHRNIYHRGLCVDWVEKKVGDAVTPSGGGVFRTSILKSVSGYNPEIPAGEEIELRNRLTDQGFKFIAINRIMATHDLNMNSFIDLLKRAIREGHLQGYALLHPEITSISKYSRLAIKNDLIVLLSILFVSYVIINQLWFVGITGALLFCGIFLLKFLSQIMESNDPIGKLLNFIFMYLKKPVQVYAQIVYIFKKKHAHINSH